MFEYKEQETKNTKEEEEKEWAKSIQ
jgi:hypothetical protein